LKYKKLSAFSRKRSSVWAINNYLLQLVCTLIVRSIEELKEGINVVKNHGALIETAFFTEGGHTTLCSTLFEN